jgi:hypothetical protein
MMANLQFGRMWRFESLGLVELNKFKYSATDFTPLIFGPSKHVLSWKDSGLSKGW